MWSVVVKQEKVFSCVCASARRAQLTPASTLPGPEVAGVQPISEQHSAVTGTFRVPKMKRPRSIVHSITNSHKIVNQEQRIEMIIVWISLR